MGRARKSWGKPGSTVDYEVLVPLRDPDLRLIIYRAADPASQAVLDAIAADSGTPALSAG